MRRRCYERRSYIRDVATVTGTSLRSLVRQAANRFSLFGKIEEIAANRVKGFTDRVREASGMIEFHETWLEKNPDAHQLAIAHHEVELDKWHTRRYRQHRKLLFWRKRHHWARERHDRWGVVLKHRRDRLRRWINQHSGFQPYMANGHPYEALTAEAKAAIARQFRRGMYVTATYEGEPGDGVHSTTSGHYLQNQPDGRGRCFDCGSGSFDTMVAAQNAEAKLASAYMVELIGPDNDCCYKNGIQYTLVEGSALETAHDNHIHEWVRDGAPV